MKGLLRVPQRVLLSYLLVMHTMHELCIVMHELCMNYKVKWKI